MFSFFKRFKKTQEPTPAESLPADAPQPEAQPAGTRPADAS
ncbi:signal recognition particle-docking protein FtsY, partial [Burkholderia sp. Ac-20353]|nr:signal recognition particle-docking protein FtsY [Burkholderia sp. Ac-20353]